MAMGRFKAVIVFVLLAPGVLLATPVRRVEVVASVPLVAHVEAPGALILAPGETRRVTLRVACNQPWLLNVSSGNPQVRASGHQVGTAGGMAAAGHTCTFILSCAPDARGPQRATLATELISGPLVAGLPR
jgi:hypothetical protein